MTTTKVNSEFIAVNAISGTIIADGAITSTHLAANCVDSSELVTGSIDTIHIAANQVTATKIVTNGVLTRHISDDQVTADKLANSINTDIATGPAALPKAGGTMTGNITLGDNNKVIFGTGSDLEIYHDGSSDVIKNATGNQIYMQSTGFNLSNSSGLKHIYANNDYGVTLFYQNNGKLETVSGGIDVTGYMDADNFKIAGAQGSDGQVLTSTGSGVAWEDAGGGSTADADGDTQIQVEESSDEDKIRFDTAGTERLVLDNNGHLLPGANNTYDLGATATRWRNIYTNDLQLSNEQGDANEIDGTQGSWTIQEGDSDLFLINRKSGKKYKFDITEIED